LRAAGSRVNTERTIVKVEALIHPESTVKNKPPHESGRAVSPGLKQSHESQTPRGNNFSILFNSVHEGIGRGQQGGVRGKSERNLRADLEERRPSFDHAIDMRSKGSAASIASKHVGSKGVNRYQDYR
jgi:hypothetical protein